MWSSELGHHWLSLPCSILESQGSLTGRKWGWTFIYPVPSTSHNHCLPLTSCLINTMQSAFWKTLVMASSTDTVAIVQSLSRVLLFVTPRTMACRAPLSMKFSRQEYWSGLPFPSPKALPDPKLKPVSPALQADSLSTEPPGKQHRHSSCGQIPHFWAPSHLEATDFQVLETVIASSLLKKFTLELRFEEFPDFIVHIQNKPWNARTRERRQWLQKQAQ